MRTKIGLGLLWVGFVVYAFNFAPPDQPDTLELIVNLSAGQWENINPTVVALFNIMGVWPIAYTCVLLLDGRNQKIPAWPFALGSFALGAFALLPYLALRDPNASFSGRKNLLLRVVDSRWTGAVVTLATVILLAGGITYGNWSDFCHQWQTSRFIHVMSLDFCLLCLLFPLLLKDDMARRGLTQPGIFWAVSLVPMLGAAVYLAWRPPVQEIEPTPGSTTADNYP
ncbi:MAG TPA: DUF2834 domain-containing protein [Oscillatoriaceae cyanobacterium M33_DOE_052]|uniref:DUF2834 domain-containing protein n=1 Tax=Planktothricoides sp. SpSt-374 TaxID=2282167 RepID=A0A7C3ZJV8_9CYAN|nr:DUF2834 domain-containing protein [Oscillatoriaceae cyanobacterium M33_DOE_052]